MAYIASYQYVNTVNSHSFSHFRLFACLWEYDFERRRIGFWIHGLSHYNIVATWTPTKVFSGQRIILDMYDDPNPDDLQLTLSQPVPMQVIKLLLLILNYMKCLYWTIYSTSLSLKLLLLLCNFVACFRKYMISNIFPIDYFSLEKINPELLFSEWFCCLAFSVL